MQEGNSFAELLKSTIEDKFKELSKPVDKLQYITVTQVSQCLRRSWYELKKGGLDLASEYADMGIAFHQLVEDAVRNRQELGTCYTEVDVVKQFYGIEVRGKIDTLCVSRNAYRIIEFKTTNMQDGFKGIESNHLRQVSFYWYLTGSQNMRKEVYLVYIDRKTGEVRVIDMGHESILRRRELGNRIKYLVRSFQTDKIPRPEPSRACVFCPYKGACKAWKQLRY
jgi:CRISPR/Cas system-associated exonuclease Cas4 (RecB family)